MKRNYRQILALILCFVFVFSFLPAVPASAEGEQDPGQTPTQGDLPSGNDGDPTEQPFDPNDPIELSITLDSNSGSVAVNQVKSVPYTIVDVDGNGDAVVTAESSDEEIAVAAVENDSILITGIKEGSAVITVTVTSIDGDKETAAYEITVTGDNSAGGGNGDGGESDPGWYVSVDYGQTSYEIEFVILEGEDYYPFESPLPVEYMPSETDPFSVPFYLKVVVPGGESRQLAPPEIQSLLTNPAVTVSETNADETDLTSYVTWDEGTASGLLSFQPGSDFTASVSASFSFDGMPYSVVTNISYSEGENGGGESFGDHVDLSYNGGTVSVYTGFVNGDELSGTTTLIDDFLPEIDSAVFDHTFFLQGFDGDPWEGAPVNDPAFYAKISNVTATLANGASGVTVSAVSTQTLCGQTRDAFTVSTDSPNLSFDDQLLISFDYEGERYCISARICFQQAHVKFFDWNGQRYAVGLCLPGDETGALVQAFLEQENTAVLTLFTVGEGGALTRVTDEGTLSRLALENVNLNAWNGVCPSCQSNGRTITWEAETPFVGALYVSLCFDGYYEDLRVKAAWRENEIPGGGPGGGDFGPGSQILQYAEQDVNVSVALYEDNSLILNDSFGDGFDPGQNKSFTWEFVLGAELLPSNENDPVIGAPADFYDRIVSCSVDLNCISGMMPTVSDPVKVAYSALGGAELYTFRFSSEPDTPFTVIMAVTFEYKPDGWTEGDDPETYTVNARVAFDDFSNNPGGEDYGPSTQSLTYGDQTVDVGAALLEDGSFLMGGGFGDGFDPGDNKTFTWEFVLGAQLVPEDEEDPPACAPAEFFDRIVSCSVDLNCISGMMPTVSDPVKVAYSELGDAELFTFRFSSEPDTPFTVIMAVTFEYRPDGWTEGDDPETYTVNARVAFDQFSNGPGGGGSSCYLSFLPSGSLTDQSFLHLIPQGTMTGTLRLNIWDSDASQFVSTPLSAEELNNVSLSLDNPNMQLSFTWDETGLVTFTHTGIVEGTFRLDYEMNDPENDVQISVNMSGEVGHALDNSTVALQYEDMIVHVSFGFLQSGSLRIGGNYGDSFSPGENKPHNRRLVLGGLLNHMDQANETYAPAGFFDRIMSCRIALDLHSGSMPAISEPVKLAYPELRDAELYTFDLTSEPDTPFEVTMILTFEYKENDWQEGDPYAVYVISADAFYQQTTDVSVDASDLLTADDLNGVLASKAALSSYLDTKGVNFTWEGTLTLDLPAVDYAGDVIVCDVGEWGQYGVSLYGSNSGSGTVLHGLEVRSGMNGMENLHFTADPAVTQSYGDEAPFTCGVLVTGVAQASTSSVYWIGECSFYGFDYATRGTPTGYQGSVMSCTISDCDYGVYIDCPGYQAAGNSENSWNTYIRCGDAICIPKLPWTITAYMYRIHDNTFIDCGRDMNITDAGTFFCYGNYFGSDLNTRRTAVLLSGENTRIIANPCRRYSGFGDADAYWIDPALPTEILNNSANSLVIDSEAFTGELITIDVVDMGDNGLDIVGTWTFGGEGA